MANVTVIGAQWGDEGKGKIVDWLASRADAVVRFQGGHNAGHTLVVDGTTYKISLVPSGIVTGTLSLIGNGVVLDPWALKSEIEKLEGQGVSVTPDNFAVADNCPLILPLHRDLDGLREAAAGSGKIGTTGRGIGPAYEDKVARRAIRMQDLLHRERFAAKLGEVLDYHNYVLKHYFKWETVDFHKTLDQTMELAEKIKPMIGDVPRKLYEANKRGENLLFEGAQGTLLDIDNGTYPFVTSSNCTAGGACTGSGMGPSSMHYILGITKAYTTRVGSGPFPTELFDADGKWLAEKGNEFGSTTGRPRRCGWFDAAALKRSIQINGLTGLCVTKLDVLDRMDTVRICTGYKVGGEVYDILPVGSEMLADCQPIYEDHPGWKESTVGVKTFEALPTNAQTYLKRMEALCGVPADIISTGPEREETIVRRHPFE